MKTTITNVRVQRLQLPQGRPARRQVLAHLGTQRIQPGIHLLLQAQIALSVGCEVGLIRRVQGGGRCVVRPPPCRLGWRSSDGHQVGEGRFFPFDGSLDLVHSQPLPTGGPEGWRVVQRSQRAIEADGIQGTQPPAQRFCGILRDGVAARQRPLLKQGRQSGTVQWVVQMHSLEVAGRTGTADPGGTLRWPAPWDG